MIFLKLKQKREDFIPLYARWSNEIATGTQKANEVMTKRIDQWYVTQKDKVSNKLTYTTNICLLTHSFNNMYWGAAVAKSLQSCPTLCNPIDSSPPGSPIPGILQVRTLEWVAIPFSKAWKWKVKVKLLSRVRLFMTPWTAAHQAPLSVGFSRQEYWSGSPLPSTCQILFRYLNKIQILVFVEFTCC